MSKHTPGPWSVREYSADIQIIAGNFREPALVRRIVGASNDCQTALRIEQAANARLIAAAPELLEALRDALAAMEHMGDVMNGMDIVTDEDEAHFPAFAKARAAITKAEGTS